MLAAPFLSNKIEKMYCFIPIKLFLKKNLKQKKFQISLNTIKFENNLKIITYYKNSWSLKNPKFIKLNRLNLDESDSEILIKFQKNYLQKQFFDLCYINRDYLSFSFLYRLTALKLKFEKDLKNKDQIQFFEKFRKKILKNTSFIDQPITQGLILAEKGIKEILTKNLLEEDEIFKSVKNDSTSVACFYLVLQAALGAWEKKEKSENEKNVYETHEKLKKIYNIVSQNEKFQELLSFELKYFDSIYNKKVENLEIESLEFDYLEGLKIISLQLEKLPSNSYGLLLGKIRKMINKIYEKNFALKKNNFTNTENNLPF